MHNAVESLDGALILVADDNEEQLFTTQTLLESAGAEVLTATDGLEAVKLANSKKPALIVMDVVMPLKGGLEAARELKNSDATRHIPILILSSRDELDDISAGVQAGAEDYIRKPFEPADFLARIRSGLHLGNLYREVLFLKTHPKKQDEKDPFDGIIGEGQEIKEVISQILRFRDSSAPVLVIGESGTGKELLARAVHATSPRNEHTFLAINCGALSENLLESQLFGYVKGAFTGAEKDRKGLFEDADGGTLFLDEVGEMSLSLQTKLLRVLQEGVITPVGATGERGVDVRIVAATHRNLEEMIAEGTFREDLYFRLKVLQLDVPSLRERISDIPLLSRHFLSRSCQAQQKPNKVFTEEALLLFEAYPWPGNIRELENEIERIVSVSGLASQIGPGYLSQKFWQATNLAIQSNPNASQTNQALPDYLFGMSLREALATVEAQIIERALETTRFNKSEASRMLGISRSNLITKVQLYSLEEQDTHSETEELSE